jgi:TPR repeat protein
MYYNGLGVSQDYLKAVEWYEKAEQEEHPAALYDLGICYYYGRGVAKNRDRAIGLWRQSAEQGFEDAVKALRDLRR